MLSAEGCRNPKIHPQNQKVNHYSSVVLVFTFLFCSFSFHCVLGTTKEVIQVFEGSSAIDAKIHPVSR